MRILNLGAFVTLLTLFQLCLADTTHSYDLLETSEVPTQNEEAPSESFLETKFCKPQGNEKYLFYFNSSIQGFFHEMEEEEENTIIFRDGIVPFGALFEYWKKYNTKNPELPLRNDLIILVRGLDEQGNDIIASSMEFLGSTLDVLSKEPASDRPQCFIVEEMKITFLKKQIPSGTPTP